MLDLIPGIGKCPKVDIIIHPIPNRLSFQEQSTSEQLPIFTKGETIQGEIVLTMVDINPFEHLGITILLIGEICNIIQLIFILDNNQTKQSTEFLLLTQDLEDQGVISKPTRYKYSFEDIEAIYESYQGTNFLINYSLRLYIIRKLFKVKETFEHNFLIQNPMPTPIINGNCRMEIGVSDKIHLEYELFQTKYHLKDIITGKLYFATVLVPIQSIEIQLIKTEKLGCKESQGQVYENIILGRLEICDGQPYEGDIIPFRMYLNGRNVSSSVRNGNPFSLSYYIKFLVLLENDKILYKNQEIILWRKEFC